MAKRDRGEMIHCADRVSSPLRSRTTSLAPSGSERVWATQLFVARPARWRPAPCRQLVRLAARWSGLRGRV